MANWERIALRAEAALEELRKENDLLESASDHWQKEAKREREQNKYLHTKLKEALGEGKPSSEALTLVRNATKIEIHRNQYGNFVIRLEHE
jgi:hypothetical protein